MEKQGCEAGDGDGCKHKGCAEPAVTWRVRRGRITLKGGIAARTKNKHDQEVYANNSEKVKNLGNYFVQFSCIKSLRVMSSGKI